MHGQCLRHGKVGEIKPRTILEEIFSKGYAPNQWDTTFIQDTNYSTGSQCFQRWKKIKPHWLKGYCSKSAYRVF